MLTNGHSKKTQDKVGDEQVYENRGGECVSQHCKEQESASSLLHLSAIRESIQWSTSIGELTDVASSWDADSGSLVSIHNPTLLYNQYGTQTVAFPNARSKGSLDQWLSAETVGHQPRPYSADIPLGGGKELLTKYRLVKRIASDANEKANADGSDFGSEDQYTRHDPTLLSPWYGTQTVALPNARSIAASDQWLSTETLGHRPRPYSADIPLGGGGKELLTKYQLVKGIASDTNEKDNADGSEFGYEDQYTRHDPTLLSPQYGTQTVDLSNARSKGSPEQWLSTETVGHRHRSYSADIPLGGGKEFLTKYRLVKRIASDANEKTNMDGSVFESEDQSTRWHSISVAREIRKPRVMPAPEWNALYLPTPASKWPKTELPDQHMGVSISRNLEKNKSSFAEGTLLSVVTREEPVPDRHLQISLESCLSEQYQLKSLPVLSPQVVVDYETSVDSSSRETPLLSLTDDQNAFSSASRSVDYMQYASPAENTSGRKDSEVTEDPPSPDIGVYACSPVSLTTLEENSYNQEIVENGTSNEEIQSSARTHDAFMVPSSSSMEEGKRVCRICNESFANSTHLRLHMSTHDLEMPFRCDSCAMSFRTKCKFVRHKKTYGHHQKINMNSTFGTSTVDDPRPFKCTDCKLAYRFQGHFSNHLRTEKHIRKLECLGKLPVGMYDKMERSSGVSLIDTTDCITLLESLQVMAQKLYQRDPRRMLCQGPDQSSIETECAMPVPTVASTSLEPILPIRDPRPTTFDPSCSSVNSPYLMKNLLSPVLQSRPFVCEICDAGFTSSSSLIAHQATHRITS